MAVETSGGAGWDPLPAPQDVVFESSDVENFLSEVTHEFMQDIQGSPRGISWAATLFRRGEAHTIAAGSAKARAADQEQWSFGDGPVLLAMRTGEFVHVPDVAQERRWPGYASAAASHGVRSLLSMPIVAAAGCIAAINLYAPSPHAFTSDDIVRTRRYVREVARALRVVLRVAERAEASAELAVAQTSLALMDLAVRTLMDDYRLSHEGAFQYLRTVARHNNLGLREAALSVIAAGSRPEREQQLPKEPGAGERVPGEREPGEPGQDDIDVRSLIGADSPLSGESPYDRGSPS